MECPHHWGSPKNYPRFCRMHDFLLPGFTKKSESLQGISGVQLAGVQLAGVQLAGVQLAGVQLAGVQLAGVQLAGVKLI